MLSRKFAFLLLGRYCLASSRNSTIQHLAVDGIVCGSPVEENATDNLMSLSPLMSVLSAESLEKSSPDINQRTFRAHLAKYICLVLKI